MKRELSLMEQAGWRRYWDGWIACPECVAAFEKKAGRPWSVPATYDTPIVEDIDQRCAQCSGRAILHDQTPEPPPLDTTKVNRPSRLTGNWRWKLTLFGKMRLLVEEERDEIDRMGNPDTRRVWREPTPMDMGLIGATFITPEAYARGERLR